MKNMTCSGVVRWKRAALLSGVLICLSSCGPSPEEEADRRRSDPINGNSRILEKFGQGFEVTREQYKDQWPYAQDDKAIIRCKLQDFGSGTAPRPIVTIQLRGNIFGLNGAALGKAGLPDATPLQARTEFGTPFLGAINTFIERAVRDCE